MFGFLKRLTWRTFFIFVSHFLRTVNFVFMTCMLWLATFTHVRFFLGRIITGSILYFPGILLTPIAHWLLFTIAYFVPPKFVFPIAMPAYFIMFILNLSHIG